MQVVLSVILSGQEKCSFSIPRDVTVVGRGRECDLRIPLSRISRKHCKLTKEGDSLLIEDLGSSNGTHVNGKPVKEAELSAGDRIGLGQATLLVRIDGKPAVSEVDDSSAAATAIAIEHVVAEPEAGDVDDLIDLGGGENSNKSGE
jgi:pSer/pThr/pTyr-binding forkhead associated (FHA) protein